MAEDGAGGGGGVYGLGDDCGLLNRRVRKRNFHESLRGRIVLKIGQLAKNLKDS